MKHIETTKGSGAVVSKKGERVAVEYELHIYEQEIPVGNAKVPGLGQCEGWISPVCFFGENGLLLDMEDRRKFEFSFTNNKGLITFSHWIE